MPFHPLLTSPVAGLLALTLALPTTAAGQTDVESRTSHLEVLTVNMLLGGVTGAATALFRGESVADGFALGAAGGSLVYLGKRVTVKRWAGAGLIGRQIASVGSSFIGNAAAGRGAFDRVAFGVGPVRVYFGSERPAAWRVDGPGAALLLWGLLSDDLELHLDESLSSGAVVFHSGTGTPHAGPSTIYFNALASPESRAYVVAHERVHILQLDQAYLSWSDPLEGWLASVSPVTRAFHSRVELNVVGLAVGVWGTRRWEHQDRPWEIEAIFLGRDRPSENEGFFVAGR